MAGHVRTVADGAAVGLGRRGMDALGLETLAEVLVTARAQGLLRRFEKRHDDAGMRLVAGDALPVPRRKMGRAPRWRSHLHIVAVSAKLGCRLRQ
jgi:hypothetical protein